MPSRATIKQYMRAALAGRSPAAPAVKLAPADKTAFPKVLALDCNHWIALGRSHYARADADAAVKPVLEALRAATSSGRLVVPIHFMNALEAARVERDDRRERLARFMVELSENHCFRPVPILAPAEKRAAVLTVYLGGEAEPVRPNVIGYGADGLIDRPHSAEAQEAFAALASIGFLDAFNAMRSSPENTVETIVRVMRSGDLIKNDRENERRGAAKIQAARDADASLTEKQRARLELSNLWDHNATDAVRDALHEAGADADAFVRWLNEDENIFRFWEAVPSVRVTLELEMKAGRNRQRKLHVNDVRDVSFYKSAVPYANIVVTENHWASTIRQAKLDRVFGTHVLTRLVDLPAVLKAEGCI